jgi:gamma-glutamyltranspeptidase/glutathione hydrolase
MRPRHADRPFPAGTVERLTAMGLAQMPGTGLLPAAVPGAFDGWMLLLRDYGTFTLRDVLSTQSTMERGFPLVRASSAPSFRRSRPNRMAELRRVWLADAGAASRKPFRTPAIAEPTSASSPKPRCRRRPRQDRSRARAFYKISSPRRSTASTARVDGSDWRAPSRTAQRRRPWRYAARIERLVDYHGFTVHKLGLVAGP